MNEESVKEMVDNFKLAIERLPNMVTKTNHVQMPMLNWEGNHPQKEFRIWRDCLQSSFVINQTQKEIQWLCNKTELLFSLQCASLIVASSQSIK